MDSNKARIIQRFTAKGTLRSLVNAKCCECIYDDIGGVGNWRQQVTSCTATTCPLYPVRPRSSQKEKPT